MKKCLLRGEHLPRHLLTLAAEVFRVRRAVYGDIEKAVVGGRRTLSQNTTNTAPTSEEWVFAYLRAKSPVARLYVAYRAILRAGLVVAVLAFICEVL